MKAIERNFEHNLYCCSYFLHFTKMDYGFKEHVATTYCGWEQVLFSPHGASLFISIYVKC